MSEPKLVSPLLDGFSMGNPMSDHDGVRCCPAIKENSDKKYIIKIVTIPATQTQLDAMLLAGAYKDPADAMDYFKGVGEGVMKEAELLKTLSRLDGFLAYEGWQMEPITRRRLGYEVYLVGSYKRSLDKYVKRNPVTHLEAINLGLDLCSALTVCREAGALYVDLKPTNVFMSEKKEYRIGDLGFISLDALHYTALPEKYRSAYTPPELHDPMAELNLSADTYAVGMILYQLYNDGHLPFKEKAPEEALPNPINADYELSEIIMKAIHPDPAQRWSDPRDMGKALAAYLQRNSVNDIPITPYVPLDVAPEDVMLIPKKKADPVDEDGAVAEASEEVLSVQQAPAAEPSGESPENEEEPDAEPVSEEPSTAQEDSTDTHSEPEAEDPEKSGEDEVLSEPEEPSDTEEAPEQTEPELQLSDELARIMAKADDLIAHETPEGVVIPEIPEPEDPFAFATEDSDEIDETGIPMDPVMEDPDELQQEKKKAKSFVSQERKKKVKKFFSTLFSLMIVAAIGVAAFWAYQNLYLQSIDDLSIEAERDQLTVTIDTDVDESLLSVICSDNYGNSSTQAVENGKATFTGLIPNTMYTIKLEIGGFHKLVGKTSDMFTTDTTTSIVSFTAVTGVEDGSVMLNFTVDGQEPDQWAVVYGTDGEREKRETFTGHSVAISDLTVGKVYTFTLEAGDDISLSGQTQMTYMASRLILAQDLTITSSNGSDIVVHWKAPGDIVVDSWNIRCYNDTGYEEKLTVSETEVLFTGLDTSVSNTVEVTASGMTQPARASITANPIRITGLSVDESDWQQMTVSWEYTGEAPSGGWLLMYSIDGGSAANVIKCDQPTAVIEPWIPDARYQFTIQAADGTSLFNNVHSYTAASAEPYNENMLSAENITGSLVKTPEDAYWRYDKLAEGAVTDQFTVGEPISIVLHAGTDFYLPGTEISILYILRDGHGNVLPELLSTDHTYWKDIWNGGDVHYGELDLPKAPEDAGSYELSIYFNGLYITKIPFTVN